MTASVVFKLSLFFRLVTLSIQANCHPVPRHGSKRYDSATVKVADDDAPNDAADDAADDAAANNAAELPNSVTSQSSRLCSTQYHGHSAKEIWNNAERLAHKTLGNDVYTKFQSDLILGSPLQ
ncbi:hypothetical protein O988_04757 [Pseudogymnoascus sp. VKM F-3808]|nr:hypothetical protein O988_04757 [Pseudogymnoascus sp. VKM F-3808]